MKKKEWFVKLSNLFYSRLFLSSLIFVIVFVALTLPFGYWGFVGDDYGNVLHAHLKSWSDLIKLFCEGDACSFYQPSNYIVPKPTFFCVYYRPVAFIFTYIQILFFGIDPYKFFLFFILFHAINSVLIFNIFSWFIPSVWAFLMALFFAFHSSMGSWFGWLPAFQQIINLTFLLLIFILIRQYFKTQNICYYLGAVFLFLVSLFNRETFFVLPFLLTLGLLFFGTKTGGLLKRLFEAIKKSLGFWLVFAFYFCIRLYFFPIKFMQTEQRFCFFGERLLSRFLEGVSFLSDLFGLAFLPCGNRLVKGILLTLISGLILILFLKSRQKYLVSFLVFSLIVLLWPAILTHYLPRSLYESAIFLFCLILIFLFKDSKVGFLHKHQWIGIITFCLLILICATSMMRGMKNTERFVFKINKAFDELCLDERILNKPLCFVNLPHSFVSSGVAQAIWMRGINEGIPIFELKFNENNVISSDLLNSQSVFIGWDYQNFKFIIL